MRNTLLLLLCCSLLGTSALAAEPAKRTTSIQSVRVPSTDMHDYAVQLLYKALIKGAHGRPIPKLETAIPMEQARAFHELGEGQFIDVHWAGTDSQREQGLRVIHIPVDRGLLGIRQFIIRRDMVASFDQIASLDDLKKFRACQGLGWPDSQILRAAGLPVTETPNFEALYKQLIAKRCDYFPRGFLEAASEMAARQTLYPELVHYQSIILYYPLPVYFFVNRNNTELGEWIESGLEEMIDDGDFLKYMQQHPNTARVFKPMQKHADANIRRFEIPNPLLTKNIDVNNTRYWFRPQDIDPNGF